MITLIASVLVSVQAYGIQYGNISDRSYLAPNESHPAELGPNLNDYSRGALISVGTERGLLTSIVAPKIDYIVQLDKDSQVVRYNQINLELLKASRSRKDYLHLRFWASYSEWSDRIPGELLQFRWWRELLLNRQTLSFWDFQHQALTGTLPYADSTMRLPFQGVNYLVDDLAYARVHDLAQRNRIEVIQVDLKDISSVRAVLKAVSEKHRISLLDLSNAWWEEYAGVEVTTRLSRVLAQIEAHALIILTDDVWIPKFNLVDWEYLVFSAGDPTLNVALNERVKDSDRSIHPAARGPFDISFTPMNWNSASNKCMRALIGQDY